MHVGIFLKESIVPGSISHIQGCIVLAEAYSKDEVVEGLNRYGTALKCKFIHSKVTLEGLCSCRLGYRSRELGPFLLLSPRVFPSIFACQDLLQFEAGSTFSIANFASGKLCYAFSTNLKMAVTVPLGHCEPLSYTRRGRQSW